VYLVCWGFGYLLFQFYYFWVIEALFAAYRGGICRLCAVTNRDDLENHWNSIARGTRKFSKSDG
jgi:hypothetical protein